MKYQIVDWTTGRRHEGPRAAAGRFKVGFSSVAFVVSIVLTMMAFFSLRWLASYQR